MEEAYELKAKNETNQTNELLGEQYTRGKILSARLKVEESHPFPKVKQFSTPTL